MRVTTNSALPFTLNDGAQWAGRGTSALVRAGVAARVGRLRVVLAPEAVYAGNAAFDFRPSGRAARSPFASPWYSGRATLDLPSRFGDRALRRITPGQSSASLTVGPIAVGAATENAVWGPGRWSPLMLSANAEGFPHAFARTSRPLRTPLGDVEARYLLGTLSPSIYLDTTITRSWRSFNGIALTLRPAIARRLTLGVERTVIAPIPGVRALASRARDALLLWEAAPSFTGRRPTGDQLTGVFGRWATTEDHAELYAEWVRQTTPVNLGEFLAAPQDGQAYTLGARVLRPLGATRVGLPARYLRFEVELTDTEQSIVFRDRPTPVPFYTGIATREGYTQRGQLIGAGIGPGASAQWIGTDYVAGAASLGLVLGRIRWNNDVLSEQPDANFFRHDVSTLAGLRGDYRLPLLDLHAEGTLARRYNYEFQNGFANPGGRRTIDVTNVTFVLGVTPR